MHAEAGPKERPLTLMVNQRRATCEVCWFLVAFFVGWALRATWLYAINESIASPTLRVAYSALLKFICGFCPLRASPGG
jgi:hypothetical protein